MSSAPTSSPDHVCLAGTSEISRRLIKEARPGNTADRGNRPALPTGLDPDSVAARIVTTIVENERDPPSSSF